MNAKHFNSFLLLAILLSVLLILAREILPAKRLALGTIGEDVYFPYSSVLANGQPAGSWADTSERRLRCRFLDSDEQHTYACGMTRVFTNEPNTGVDFSGYTHLQIQINHTGNSDRRIRLSMRNFNTAYSLPEDPESSKFLAISLRYDELNRETRIPLNDFSVADWWLDAYSIPRELARQELDNIQSLAIDFVRGFPPGEAELEIKSLSLVGEWVARETWYLTLLGLWLLGLACYALTRLIHLSRQTHHDTQVINSLYRDKQFLQLESDKFRRLSTVDPLTSAYNRFGIDQIMATLIHNNSSADSTRYALIIADIDYFKRINDTYGHDLGDNILQQAANIIQQNIRTQDILGRWGGEEFIVILPGTQQALALDIAERIRLAMMQTHFGPKGDIKVTLSLGVSEHQPGDSFSTTFKRADEALYAAKADGRNCCRLQP